MDEEEIFSHYNRKMSRPGAVWLSSGEMANSKWQMELQSTKTHLSTNSFDLGHDNIGFY